jgi:serine/threonine protein kinase
MALWEWFRKVIDPNVGCERAYSDLAATQQQMSGQGERPGGAARGPASMVGSGELIKSSESLDRTECICSRVGDAGTKTASGRSSLASSGGESHTPPPAAAQAAAVIAPVVAERPGDAPPMGLAKAESTAADAIASCAAAAAATLTSAGACPTPAIPAVQASLSSQHGAAENMSAAPEMELQFESHSFVLGGVQFEVDSRYTMKAVVGKGAYGIVASAEDRKALPAGTAVLVAGEAGEWVSPDGSEGPAGSALNTGSVAIKKIFDPFHDRTDCKRLLREIRLLRVLRHPNVLHLLDILPPTSLRCSVWKDVYLVTKLYDTNLHRVIYSGQPLSDEHIQYILWQVGGGGADKGRKRTSRTIVRAAGAQGWKGRTAWGAGPGADTGASAPWPPRGAHRVLPQLAVQALRALRYMHRAGVVHRDMKPTNILLNRDCELAVADLGLARFIGLPGGGRRGHRDSIDYLPGLSPPPVMSEQSNHLSEPSGADADEITGQSDVSGGVGSGVGLGSLTKYVVTRWYRAPELLVQNQQYDSGVDMWSLGCIVGELLGARALFPGRDSLHQLKLIVERLGAPSKDEL